MRSMLRKALIAIPVTALFSAVSFAQITTVVGDIKTTDGKPVENAIIKIERLDVKGNYKTKTNKKGHYAYTGLPIGAYKITVEVDGKDMDAVNGVRTKLGDPTDVSFQLGNQQNQAAAAGAAAPPRGLSDSQKADYEKQKKENEEIIKKNAELNAAFGAGREAEAAKNWDVAIDNFTKATSIDGNQHVVWSHLADSYIARSGGKTGAEQQADIDKGVEAYKKAIEIKPDDPGYHNNYGLVLAKAKKYDEAQSELNKAAQLDAPNAGKYYFNLGAVYVNTGNSDAAAEAFKKATEADPNYADAHYQYGVPLLGKATTTGDGKVIPPAGTEAEFQKYLQLAPTGPFADQAKSMLASLGATVQTNFSQKKK